MLLRVSLLAWALLFQQTLHPDLAPPKWVLTFADEFDGNALDLSRWIPRNPRGQQAYAPELLQVSGGQIHIMGSGALSAFGIFAQTCGRYEIRGRIPAGRGLRAGFHLLPVPAGALPSIEVFQANGDAPSKISFANRWGTEQTERSFGDSFAGPDLSGGFHTIALEWEPDTITWFVDGKQKFQSVDGIPHQPMYMLLELAVAKAPDSSTKVSAAFDVDYIRVYRRPR